MLSASAIGARVAARFVVETLAGIGGMGAVYRARDEETGRTIALKVIRASGSAHGAERFARESRLLSELCHPGIVAYLAHGVTEAGEPYLAMEWLDGEDLSKRLDRGPLTLAESLTVLRRSAEALAVAHGRGVVHRDLKPSNLFLRDGQVERVALLDFGIARRASLSHAITRTGMVMGTPGYMAPEQARGERDITPAADVFSLGCVLFECLTGEPPFVAEQPMAVMAKILFEEPPKLRRVRPELPKAVEALLGRMLVKEAALRLPDATAILEAIDALREVCLDEPAKPAGAAFSRRVETEQQLISVLMARPAADAGDGAAFVEGATLDPQLSGLHGALEEHGARVELLADGSLVATLVHARGAATDQAAQAARCALLIRERWPGAKVALCTGRGQLRERWPVGEVLGRAAALLHARPSLDPSEQILLDEVTAGLLHVRFHTHRTPTGAHVLAGEDLELDASRPLLGKPTPCVGRDVELVTLETALAVCIEESRPLAVLVTAPPGVGKSRLRHEFLRRVEARGEEVLILIGRGDPMSAGSSYGLLGQAVRRLCGIQDGEGAEAQRRKLAQRIGERVPAGERERVTAFLGEMCGVPFPDEDNARLRAARQDPLLMSGQITQAMLDFLRAEGDGRAVLLVLEDLHWGDALTVKLCEVALRELKDQPLMVLSLARPEVSTLFPRLWAGATQLVPLRPLSKKAGERLVREVLGRQVPQAQVARIVEQSEGNALFLEELIRAVAEGRGDEVPETVLAILQARIGRLPLGPRRLLRAASVFGEVSWLGGIDALLGGAQAARDLEGWLVRLIEAEILEQRQESRFPGERELRFRHALMRDAAYGLLTEDDRTLWHRLAGGYLETVGERDPLVLAEHYQRGGALDHAVRCYVRAAKELFDRHDQPGALRCIEAGIACGASGAERRLLSAIRASSVFWMGDYARACSVGGPLVSELPAGSYPWWRLVAALLLANLSLGKQQAFAELRELLMAVDPADDVRGIYVEALSYVSIGPVSFGARKDARVVLDRIDAVSAPVLGKDAFVDGWACFAHSLYHYFLGDSLWRARCLGDDGTEAFRQLGDHRNQVAPEGVTGLARAALGDDDGAVATLRECLTLAERIGQPFPISYAKMYLCLVLGWSDSEDRRDEAAAIARAGVDAKASSPLFLGIAHDALARRALRGGDLAEALACAQKASELLTVFRPYRLFALETLSEALLALGRAGEAKEVAAVGVQIANDLGGAGELGVRLALVLALDATGEADAARAALRKAVERLCVRADNIPEPAARERYLTRVATSARLVALAKEWLGLDVYASTASGTR